jgi:hypothetical protein
MAGKIPQEYICPITLLPMKDPVIGSDRQTYEREAIVQWLQSNPNSPLTRQPMNIASLRPNVTLKAAIERWNKKAAHPTGLPKPSAPPSYSVDADHYYALSVYQQDLQQVTEHSYLQKQPLLPTTTTSITSSQRPSPWNQMNQKEKQQCIAFGVLVIGIFIFVVILMKG